MAGIGKLGMSTLACGACILAALPLLLGLLPLLLAGKLYSKPVDEPSAFQVRGAPPRASPASRPLDVLSLQPCSPAAIMQLPGCCVGPVGLWPACGFKLVAHVGAGLPGLPRSPQIRGSTASGASRCVGGDPYRRAHLHAVQVDRSPNTWPNPLLGKNCWQAFLGDGAQM